MKLKLVNFKVGESVAMNIKGRGDVQLNIKQVNLGFFESSYLLSDDK